MNRNLRVIGKWSGFVLLAVCWAFMFAGSPAQAKEKSPINIGVTTDFSGVTASFGVTEVPSFKMVVAEANKAGGIDGRPIKLFILDNGGDPARAVGDLKMLKDMDHCVAMIAGVTSSVGIATKAWATQNHIPVISPDPQSDQLIQKKGKSWYFVTEVPAPIRANAVLARFKAKGFHKVGFEGTTLAWGTDWLKVLKKRSPAYGVKIVGEVFCTPKTRDLTIQARKLRNSGAKAVITVEYEAETCVWAKALKDIGWHPYVLHASAANLVTALATCSPQLFDGWETFQQFDITKPMLKETLEKYKAYTGKYLVGEKVPRSVDAARLLLEAIRLSGNPDNPAAIRDGFYKIKDFPLSVCRKSTMGSFVIGRNYLASEKDLIIYVAKNGKLVPTK